MEERRFAAADDGGQGRRRHQRRLAVLTAVLMATSAMVTTSLTTPASAADALVLSVDLGERVGGGVWSLTVPRSTPEGVGLRLLEAGPVPEDGRLSIPVPGLGEGALGADETTFLHVSASRLDPDTKTAWVTSASVGLVGREIGAGGAHVLTPTPIEVVDVETGDVDLTPISLDQQRRVEPAPPPEPSGKPAAPAKAPVRGEPRPVRGAASSRAATVSGLPASTAVTAGQGLVPQAVVAPAGCNPSVCERVVASKLIPGVRAFRWFSSQGLGTTATFRVESGFEQQWQNGVRVGSDNSGFVVEGHTTRTKAVKTDIIDTWPTRADCWEPAQRDDGPNCGTNQSTGHGFVPTYGRDTWQWQKVKVTVTCGGMCYPYTYKEERLRNYQYDGGTEVEPVQLPDFDKRPAEVRAGRWGSFAVHQPASRVQVSTETAVTVEEGAVVKLEFSAAEDAFNATFTSTSTQRKVDRISDAIYVRDQAQLPFLTDRLRYDGRRTRWKYVYWTCENESGWTGGECWEHGS